ncbi:hypothetical protein [Nocardiopsis oceani]
MARALLLAFSSPSATTDDAEFGRWCDEVHIPQVVEHVKGVVSGARFAIPEEQVELAPSKARFVNAYQVEADDVGAVMAELGAATQDRRVELSEVLRMDPAPVLMLCSEPG